MLEPAAPIADKVYVTTQLGGMYCLAVQTGQQLWWTPGIMRFIAASKDRVYGEDANGNIVVLHAQTGGRLDVIPAAGLPIKMMNLQTDRLYLASESGLVQCLHEIELEKPILHRPKPAPKPVEPKPKKTTPAKTEQPGATPEPSPVDSTDPFSSQGGGTPAADPFGTGTAPAADPFGMGGGGGAAPADNPFGTGGGGGAAPADNPFGTGGSGGAAPADNPFGTGAGGNTEPADNPFGTGTGGSAAPVDDPFS